MTKYFRPILVSENPLSNDPSHKEKVLDALRCPPHGFMGRILTLVIVVLALWATCLSIFPPISEEEEIVDSEIETSTNISINPLKGIQPDLEESPLSHIENAHQHTGK